MPVPHDTLVQVLVKDQQKLLAYILAIVGDDHVAEDVGQEVMTLAFGHRDELNDERHVLAWMREAARRKSLEALRKLRREPGPRRRALRPTRRRHRARSGRNLRRLSRPWPRHRLPALLRDEQRKDLL